MSKDFAMSTFSLKADLFEAKALYFEKKYKEMRDVAVQADMVHDEFVNDDELPAHLRKALRAVGDALSKVEL